MKFVLSVFLLPSLVVTAQQLGEVQSSGNASAQANASAEQTTVIPVVLNKTVDSKKAKVGDEVTARVASDVKTVDGLAITRDSKLIGKITQANARSKGDGTSALGFSFDYAALKNGTMLNLVATIQAVVAAPQPPPAASTEPMTDASSSSSGGYGDVPASRGPIGAVGSTAGGSAGDLGNTAGTGTPNTVGGVGQVAGSEPQITARTTGVVGIKNVEIQPSSSAGTVITSSETSVKLDGGTRLLVSVTRASVAEPQSKPKK